MQGRWSHFERKALNATGQSLQALIEQVAAQGPPTPQEVSRYVSVRIGELYSPESARYGCHKYGILLAEGPSHSLRLRHKGRHQRIIADYVVPGGSFAWAVYHLARTCDRFDLTRLARRLANHHHLSQDQAKALMRCLLDACAFEAWLSLGGSFAGPGRADHARAKETERADEAVAQGTVLLRERQGPGALLLFADGSGALLRSDARDKKDYMRLQDPESMVWYRLGARWCGATPWEEPHVRSDLAEV